LQLRIVVHPVVFGPVKNTSFAFTKVRLLSASRSHQGTLTTITIRRFAEESLETMSHDNIAPQVITRILREVRDLSRKPADGIAYMDNTENSVAEIHAIITGPGKFGWP
jgi:hypothetical protein